MEQLKQILSGYMSNTSIQKGMSENKRARIHWMQAAGPLERKHTTGVFMKHHAGGKILGVFVDSNMARVEFRAKTALYIARLASVGCEVADIEFIVTRRPKEATGVPSAEVAGAQTAGAAMQSRITTKPQVARIELPPATPEDIAQAEAACARLPEGLRQKAQEAYLLWHRRQKLSGPKTQ